MNLRELAGHHLMIGIQGGELTASMVKQFRETHAVGLIVFRPNFKSAESFKKLISGLEKALGRRLLVAVDHEGGRVIHAAGGITVFPDNWMLGNTGKTAYAAKQGDVEAKELRRLGIDLNLAPTLDVLTKNFSPNIGIRSYGMDAGLVSRLGQARIQAMQSRGLSACAKHFPGLGAATLDPHLDLPALNMTWDELRRKHLKPFRAAIQAGADCVMSSHPVYPRLDASRVPATFSRKIIRGFLRGELGFRGVILSDDLEMGALRGICSLGESAVRAVEAGHDMVLVCHKPQAQKEAAEAIVKAYESGRLNPDDLKMSAVRIQNLMTRRKKRFEGGRVQPEKTGAKLARQIARQGIKFHPAGAVKMTQRPQVIFPRLSELSKKFLIEPEMMDEKKFIGKLFSKLKRPRPEVHLVSLCPDESEVKTLLKKIEPERSVVFFCYDAHLFAGCRKILEFLERKKNSSAVLLRDPYDAVYLRRTPYVTAFGFRKVQLEAAVESLNRYVFA